MSFNFLLLIVVLLFDAAATVANSFDNKKNLPDSSSGTSIHPLLSPQIGFDVFGVNQMQPVPGTSRRLVTASQLGQLAIWDLDSLNQLQRLPLPVTNLEQMTTSAEGQVLATIGDNPDQPGQKMDLDVWLTADGRHLLHLNCDQPEHLTLSPQGKYVAFVDRKREVIVWNTSTGKVVGSAVVNGCQGLSFSNEFTLLAASAEQIKQFQISAKSGVRVSPESWQQPLPKAGEITSILYLSGEICVLENSSTSFGSSPSLKVLRLQPGDPPRIILDVAASAGTVVCQDVQVDATRTLLKWDEFGTNENGTPKHLIRMFNLKDGSEAWSRSLSSLGLTVPSTFSTKGEFFAVLANDAIFLLDLRSGLSFQEHRLAIPSQEASAICFDPERPVLLCTVRRPEAGFLRWNANNGKPLYPRMQRAAYPTGLVFDQFTGRLVVANNLGGLLQLDPLDLDRSHSTILPATQILPLNENELATIGPLGLSILSEFNSETFPVTNGRLTGVCISRDGNEMVVGTTKNGRTTIWRPKTSREVIRTSESSGFGTKMALSPNGRYFAVFQNNMGPGASDSQVVLRDTRTGSIIKKLPSTFPSGALSFSPDSKYIISVHQVVRGFDPVFSLIARPIEGKTLARSIGRFLACPLDVQFSADGRRVAVTAGTQIQVFSWLHGTKVMDIGMSGNERMSDVALDATGTMVAAVAFDRTVRIHRVADGRELVRLVTVGLEDYLLFTPENGTYYVSSGASEAVNFRLKNQLYSLRQFDLWFNRPDTILKRLKGDIETIKWFHSLRLRRLEEASLHPETRNSLMGDLLPGKLEAPALQVVPSLRDVSTAAEHLSLQVSTQAPKGTSLSKLNVIVNGVPTVLTYDAKEIRGSSGLKINGNHWTGVVSLPLSRGRNRISVFATDASGIESLRWEYEIEREVQETPLRPNLYLACFGVSNYLDGRTLPTAAVDAADVVQQFQSLSGTLFDKVFVYQDRAVVNTHVTRSVIEGTQAFAQQAGIDDIVIVYLSGHGRKARDGTYLFECADTTQTNVEASGAGFAILEDIFEGSASRKKVLILDTCHAAARRQPTPKTGVAQRSFAPESGLEDIFVELERGSGAVVLAASRGTESAIQSNTERNSLFTGALLAALQGECEDHDGDNQISVSEAKRYVDTQVKRNSRGLQRPITLRQNFEFDFPLAVKISATKQ